MCVNVYACVHVHCTLYSMHVYPCKGARLVAAASGEVDTRGRWGRPEVLLFAVGCCELLVLAEWERSLSIFTLLLVAQVCTILYRTYCTVLYSTVTLPPCTGCLSELYVVCNTVQGALCTEHLETTCGWVDLWTCAIWV